MIIRFFLLYLTLGSLSANSQPTLKLLNLESGTSYKIEKNSRIIIFIKEKKFNVKVGFLTDSGIYSNKKIFFRLDSITQISVKNHYNYMLYTFVGIPGIIITVAALIANRPVSYNLREFVYYPVTFSSSLFGVYKILNGFKRKYKIDKTHIFIYSPNSRKAR